MMSVPAASFVMWVSLFVTTTPARNTLWIVYPVVDVQSMAVFAKKLARTMKVAPMASFVMAVKAASTVCVKQWAHIPPVRSIHHRVRKRSMFVAVLAQGIAPLVSVMMNALSWTNV
jgi:hypothetical protein